MEKWSESELLWWGGGGGGGRMEGSRGSEKVQSDKGQAVLEGDLTALRYCSFEPALNQPPNLGSTEVKSSCREDHQHLDREC